MQDWAKYEVDAFVADQNERTAKVDESNSNASSTPYNHHDKKEEERASAILQQLKSVMWDHVGVVRSKSGLEGACVSLFDIQKEADEIYKHAPSNVESFMLRDASYAGLAVANAALQNNQSRGAHYLAEESCDADDEQVVAM